MEIKVGQVWKQTDGAAYSVIAIHGKRVWCEDIGDDYTFECRVQDILRDDVLVEPMKPWEPLPEGYRLVEDAERKVYAPCKEAKFFFDKWRDSVNYDDRSPHWSAAYLYAVPINHKWQKMKSLSGRRLSLIGKTMVH